MPMRAMPPATERPTIVDVPTDLLAPPVFWSAPADELEEGADADGVTVTNIVLVPPSLFVVNICETVGEGCGACDVGGEDVGVGALDVSELVKDEVLSVLVSELVLESLLDGMDDDDGDGEGEG